MHYLGIVILQSQDEKKTILALQKAGIEVESIATIGGLLAQKNSTLLLNLEDHQIDEMMNIIKRECRQRIEYITTPLESAPLPIPISTPVTIGGATVFLLPIETYEEY